MLKFRSIAGGVSIAAMSSLLLAGAATASTVEVTITNTQAAGGLFLTPLWTVFHDGTFDSFDAGSNANAGVELLAEEGSPATLNETVAARNAGGANFQTGFITNAAGFGGAPVLDPGEVSTVRFDLDTINQRYFSFLSMVIPSNDTFIGNDNPLAYELFNSMGDFVFDRTITVTAADAWDAGTELDDGNGAAFAPPTSMAATDTFDPIVQLNNLDFLFGRPQAPGGVVGSTTGTLATITITEVSPVPLPAAAPFLLAGLGAFAVARRRQSKRST